MKRTLLLSMSLVLLLTGCGTDALDTGRVRLLLTDAPAEDADGLIVEFGRVDLVPSDEEEEGIVTLADSSGEIDVLELRNGEYAMLAEREIPAGSYSQVRLIVDTATLWFGDESSAVTVPSGPQTGLKVNVEPPLLVHGDQTSTVTIDFDVTSAVIETPPGSGNYLLKPTGIRAVTVSGVVTGLVLDAATGEPLDPSASATVTVYDEADAYVTSTRPDDVDGSFKIISLTEGTYRLEFSADGYTTVDVFDVEVIAGETTVVESVELEAQLEPAPETGAETVPAQ